MHKTTKIWYGINIPMFLLNIGLGLSMFQEKEINIAVFWYLGILEVAWLLVNVMIYLLDMDAESPSTRRY